ncbi:hypothetical protein AYO40_05105 [Planctomycetaceae bacterium SCGC AG-212-D15]|nr:hypothetical protein AYO40_05105 [Planctomycetaceae bacterium SCGC AG-212-D15]
MPTAALSSVLRFLRRVANAEGDTDEGLLARFIGRRDEGAFEALVERHGPMVLSVCQRIVRDPHLAEDSFQATFLVLARKAGAIADPRSLASWLHGVAVRVARKARGQEAQRRSKLMTLESRSAGHADSPSGLDDLKPLLDEEVNRLPAKYRELVVLCYLEGMTNSEAARQLRCPEGTVFGRLARARRMLQTRLVRRGITLSVAALFERLIPETQGVTLPPALAAKATAVVGSSAGVSPIALSLAHEVMQAMLCAKIMKVTVVTLMLVALAATLGVMGADVPGTLRALARSTPLRPGEEKKEQPPVDPQAVDKAVADGLAWLVKQQEEDGSWPGKDREKIENTSLTLLALLASGHTHKTAIVEVQPTYAKNFERGLKFLLTQQDRTGAFDSDDLSAHAKATMVVCEAYVMTLDPALKGPAQRGLNFIANAQQDSGGWPLRLKADRWNRELHAASITSTAWQLSALKSGQIAGRDIPAKTLDGAQKFLDACAGGDTAAYAVAPKGKITPAATAMALRGRQFLGWGPKNPGIEKGSQWLARELNPKDLDFDALFFATQVFDDVGRDTANEWNAKMLTALLQYREEGRTSMPVRVRTRALAVLSLEIYHRRLPTFFRK